MLFFAEPFSKSLIQQNLSNHNLLWKFKWFGIQIGRLRGLLWQKMQGCGRVWGLRLYEKQDCEIIIPTVVSYHTLRGFLRSALPWLLSDWSVVCTRLSLDTFITRQGCMGSISADDRMFIRFSLCAWSMACYKRINKTKCEAICVSVMNIPILFISQCTL